MRRIAAPPAPARLAAPCPAAQRMRSRSHVFALCLCRGPGCFRDGATTASSCAVPARALGCKNVAADRAERLCGAAQGGGHGGALSVVRGARAQKRAALEIPISAARRSAAAPAGFATLGVEPTPSKSCAASPLAAPARTGSARGCRRQCRAQLAVEPVAHVDPYPTRDACVAGRGRLALAGLVGAADRGLPVARRGRRSR